MIWYYVDAGKQAGPVDDAQLQQLVASGKITANTPVWNENMTDWQRYREVVEVSAAPAPSGDQVTCAECGRAFPRRDMISYGAVRVCAGCKPIFLQKLAEGAPLQRGALRYAGFWIRVGAKLIDGFILAAVFMGPLIYFAIKGAQEPGRVQVAQILWQGVYILGNMAYSIFFLGKYGATPGKMACSLRVVTGEGGRIGYGRATGRFFAEMLSQIICYIGYIMVAFDSQKRGLHDHICNTRVIYK